MEVTGLCPRLFIAHPVGMSDFICEGERGECNGFYKADKV